MVVGPNTLERFAAWTSMDMAAFETRLRQLCPHLRVFTTVTADPPLRQRQQEIASLSDVKDGMATILFPAPGWIPSYETTGGQQILTGLPQPFLLLRYLPRPGSAHLGSSAPPARRQSSHLWFVYDKSARDQAELVKAAARIVDVTGSRHVFDRNPDTKEIHPRRRGPIQIGHDMARLCKLHPGFLIEGLWRPASAVEPNDADLLPETGAFDCPVFLVREDEDILSRHLQRAFPRVLFVDGALWWEGGNPELRTSATIGASPEGVVSVLFPEVGWQPTFALGRSGRWRVVNRPYPVVTIRRSEIVSDPVDELSPTPSRLTMGSLICRFLAGDRDSKARAERVMAELKGIASPFATMVRHFGTDTHRYKPGDTGVGLFGSAAMRWAAAEPGRALAVVAMPGSGVVVFVPP